MNEENREAHINVVNHIDMLANSTQIDISDWNILEIFGSGEGKKLITDFAAVNDRFFEHYRATRPDPKDLTLDERMSQRVREIAQTQVAGRILEMESNREAHFKQASKYYKEYEKEMSAGAKLGQELIVFRRDGARGPQQQIEKILSQNFWGTPAVEGRWLYLTTNNDCVLAVKNKAAGIDLRVDLGKFAVKVDLQTLSTKVLPLEGNSHIDGHIHPYINGDGEICWGNAKSAAHRFIRSGDFVGLMTLLAALLTQYDDQGSNPYRSIIEWGVEGKAVRINMNDQSTHTPSLIEERSLRDHQIEIERKFGKV